MIEFNGSFIFGGILLFEVFILELQSLILYFHHVNLLLQLLILIPQSAKFPRKRIDCHFSWILLIQLIGKPLILAETGRIAWHLFFQLDSYVFVGRFQFFLFLDLRCYYLTEFAIFFLLTYQLILELVYPRAQTRQEVLVLLPVAQGSERERVDVWTAFTGVQLAAVFGLL